MRNPITLAVLLALACMPLAAGAADATSDERPRAIIDDPSERNALGYGTSGIPAEAPPEGYGLGVTSNLGGPRAPSEAEPGPDVSDERPRAIVDDPSERSTLGYGTSGIAEEVPPGNIGLESNLGAPESAPAPDAEEPGRQPDTQPEEGSEPR